ncbi:MAG: hypothetical protein HQ530_05505 [Parcubacteria group bacterium]|nr:hypothetical protein [Parcubacteria group bacterium]
MTTKISLDKSLNYQRHQRDYSMLGSTVVIKALYNENKQFFGCAPHPTYLIVKDDIFYHFMSKEDGLNRCQSWLENNGIEELQKVEQEYEEKMAQFNKFCATDHKDSSQAIAELWQYFIDFTNIIFIGYELPENCGTEVSKELYDLCFQIRRKFEDAHKKCFVIEEKIINQVAQEEEVDKEILLSLTVTEFEKFLASKQLPAEIASRQKFFLVKYSEQGEERYFDPNLWAEFAGEASGKLKGQTAHPGVVKGKVRIIRKVKDSRNFQTGEILVASMTDPRYLPIMEKAAAFVTDEGGITCHAAIVAREMQKPCIIGTKEATTTLSDGDLVEVNADQGTVNIIKKA